MAQSKEPPATRAGGNSPDPKRESAGGPSFTKPPNPAASAAQAGELAPQDRETILLALRLAADFLDSIIDGETLDGTRIARGHPLRLAIERWQQQRKRIAEIEARLGASWRKGG